MNSGNGRDHHQSARVCQGHGMTAICMQVLYHNAIGIPFVSEAGLVLVDHNVI